MISDLNAIGKRLINDNANDNRKILERYFIIEPQKYERLVDIIYDVDKRKIVTEVLCDKTDQKDFPMYASKYLLFPGTFSASREKIYRLTFDDLEYIKNSEDNAIFNILKILEKSNNYNKNGLKDHLKKIYDTFYSNGNFTPEVEDQIKKVEIKGSYYTVSIRYTSAPNKTIHMATLDDYWKYIFDLIIRGQFMQSEKFKGTCSVCGQKKEILGDPKFEKGSFLKMYITDQLSSAPNLSDRDFWKNFPICNDCRASLIVGSKVIESKLKSTILELKLDIIIVPSVANDTDPENKIENYSELFPKIVGTQLINMAGVEDGLQTSTNLIPESADTEESGSTMPAFTYIIFGKGEGAHFSYFGSIEVPSTTLSLYLDNADAIGRIRNYLRPRFENDGINLSTIASIFPLKKKVVNNRVTYYLKPLVNLYTSLLSGRPLPEREIYGAAATFAKSIIYENIDQYSLGKFEIYRGYKSNKERALARGIVKFNYLLILNKYMAENQKIEVDGESLTLNDLLGIAKLSKLEKGLVWLGYTIGQVALAEKAKYNKIAIWDKINYNGMDKTKVMRIAEQALEYIKMYDLEDEQHLKIYKEAMALLSMNIEGLERDPLTNLFYILTGFSFGIGDQNARK